MNVPHIAIITPALAKANNGNWQTANRWAGFLRKHFRVSIDTSWQSTGERRRGPDAMIALHARRSADAIAQFRAAHPQLPIVLVLTGTDVYRDIHVDASARKSLELATTLVVLQEAAVAELPAPLRAKATVIHQSAPRLQPPRWMSSRHLDVAMIGHLRAEKDPLAFVQAARLVKSPKVRMLQIGGILEPALQADIDAALRDLPHYRWLGNLSHGKTRQRLKRCKLLVIPSRMEGGANVIIEALTSGVPVIASDISGNRGMLGNDYRGYFPVGDSAALARLIDRALADPDYLAALTAQCAARAPLFEPAREKAALLQLMDNLLSR